jgi:hypothetical protein
MNPIPTFNSPFQAPSPTPFAGAPPIQFPATAPTLWIDDQSAGQATGGGIGIPDLRAIPMRKPRVKRLLDLLRLPEKDPNEVFLNRFLCRRGCALFVGETGRGKSTFLMAASLFWVLGKEYHGFRPLRPLRVLVVQAENDDHDLKEQFSSAVGGVRLSPAELQVIDEALLVLTVTDVVGAEFAELVRRVIVEHRADLVIIDPVLAFLGGDANSQADVGGFLRQQLAPVLHETNAAAILIHHTAKPSSAGKKATSRQDAYLGAGSAEWANFARAVFGLSETNVDGFYELALYKRGRRAGWRNDEGELVTKRYLRQSRVEGDLSWLPVSYKEFATAADTAKAPFAPSVEEFLELFPVGHDGDPKRALLSTDEIKAQFKTRRWDINAYSNLRDIAQSRGELDVLVGARNAKLTGRPAIVAEAKAKAEGEKVKGGKGVGR